MTKKGLPREFSTALRVMPFPRERLYPVLDPPNHLTSLLCSLSPPFELHAKFVISSVRRTIQS